MPPQIKKSGLAAKYGAKLDAAIKGHANDETNYGIIRLPGGINRGIAQLTECKFDQYKSGQYQGEYYFRAAGVVLEPKSVMTPSGEQSVAGLQTSVMIPCCDTKNQQGEVTTQERHVEDILNELRKLGIDTSGATIGNLEDLAAAVKEAQPYFYFSTSESKGGINPKTGKNYDPRVWENWHGSKGLENYTGISSGPSVGQDNTGDASQNTAGTMPNLDALAEAADNDPPDMDAQATLTAIADKNGITDEQMSACSNWAQVVGLINGEEPQPKPETNGYAVGQTYKYKAPAGPGKKPGKPVDVEMVKYDPQKGLCDLKNLADKRVIYKGITVDKLITE